MGLTGTGMETFTDQLSTGIENHGTHQWIGTGGPIRQGRQSQGTVHPTGPHQLSGSVWSERHSPTT